MASRRIDKLSFVVNVLYTDKKENQIFLANKEILNEAVGGGGGRGHRRGGGLRQINTCRKVPLQVNFFG
jgi:hypothetical protein